MTEEIVNSIKVVCFDLDDTLCDESKSVRIARSKVFEYISSKYEEVNLSKFQKEYIEIWKDIDKNYVEYILQPGIGDRELRLDHANRVLNACRLSIPKLAIELTNIFWEERKRALKLFPDAFTALASLSETYALSLLANGPSDMQRQKIEDLQIAKYFDHIIIAGEVGFAKPDRKIFKILINKYSLPASQILYVGNSQKRDVTGAYRAGLKIAWVNRKNETLSLKTPKPHYEVKNLLELIDILS